MLPFAFAKPLRQSRPARFVFLLGLLPAGLAQVTGCDSRPDPLAVVKDGGDDDEDIKTRPPAVGREPRQSEAGAAPAAKAQPAARVPSSGSPPFDLTFLPLDSELIIYADAPEILRSPLVNEVTDHQPHVPFNAIMEGTGVTFGELVSITVGIRELERMPAPTLEWLKGGLSGLSLFALATHPDVKSTIVLKTRERVDDSHVLKRGDLVNYHNSRYIRLRTSSFNSPCGYVTRLRTLVISDEATIRAIIDAGKTPPQPTTDFSFAREAEVVVALAPRNPEVLRGWLPAAPSPGSEETTAAPAARDVASSSGNHAAPIGRTLALAPLAIVREHATGAACLLKLHDGVAVSLGVRCDSAGSTTDLVSELSTWVFELQRSHAAHAETLPAGFQDLVESLRVDQIATIAALSAAVPVARQTDVLAIPGFLLALAVSGDADARAVIDVPAEHEAEPPPGALAQRVLTEGIPPLPLAARPPGMELRALSRWQPSATGGPRQMEVAVVAFGGPATTAAAMGHMQLEAAEINRLAPLKWLGTSTVDQANGLDPISGFVPIDHEEPRSEHPRSGVLAVFTLVPPSEPATSLRRFSGRMVVRYFSVTDEFLIPVREATLPAVDRRKTADAGLEIELSNGAGRETLNVIYDKSASIASLQLVAADGAALPEAESTEISSQGKVLRSFWVGDGPLPAGASLRVTLHSGLRDLEVPFEFANLPIPDVGVLSESQREALVWTEAESDSGLPPGLVVEAQARWDNPDAVSPLTAATATDQRRPVSQRVVRYVPSDSDKDGGRPQRPKSASDQPLRVVVDLTGPLAAASEAIGDVELTSIETDFGSELVFEGAHFRHHELDGEFVPLGHAGGFASGGPPGGLRLAFHFAPTPVPIHQLTHFNGSLKLRTTQERRATVISRLHERTGNRITDRELSKVGVALAAAIEQDRVFLRLIEGEDEQLSEIVAVDSYGDPVPGVTATTEPGRGKSRGRLVHVLTFANGVPSGIGLRVFVNSGVTERDVSFRFTNIPIPPPPGLRAHGLD